MSDQRGSLYQSRWVSVSYPDPPKEEGGTTVASFPVYFQEEVELEWDAPAILVRCDGNVEAVIVGATRVHLCNLDTSSEPAE